MAQQQQHQPQDHHRPPVVNQSTTIGGGAAAPTANSRPNLNFQRSNNIYWTLQLKNRPQQQQQQQPPVTPQRNIEDLYSTPNKLTKTPRTPVSGFSTFFKSTGGIGGETGASINSSSMSNNDSITEPISPINPRNIMDSSNTSLLTSTPTGAATGYNSSMMTPTDASLPRRAIISPATKPKLSEELRNKLKLSEGGGIRSHGNSPSNSGRSTPRNLMEQQPRGRHSWANDSVEVPRTCSDRMGTPKTSLMDFKKLLLSKSSVKTAKSTSAVEQLLLNKATPSSSPVPNAQPSDEVEMAGARPPTYNRTANLSALKIHDMSGSPKTFANRRVLRAPGNYGSPARGGGKVIGSAPTVAAIKAVKHDIISTSIPEDHSEEENLSKTPPPPPSPAPHSTLRHQSSDELSPISPPSPAPTAFDAGGIVTESTNLRDNFFLKTEENNFPRNEILQRLNQGPGGAYARKQFIQQQRQQFMTGGGGTSSGLGYNNNSQFVQNRNLMKVGGTLSAIAENQPAAIVTTTSSAGVRIAGYNETGALPTKPQPPQPSLETSF